MEGDTPAARRLFEQAMGLLRTIGERLGEADTLGHMGELARGQSDLAAARAFFTQALRIYAEIGARRTCALTLERLAMVDAAEGEVERALRRAGAAAAVREDTGAQAPASGLAEIERVKDAARQGLGEPAAAAGWEAGRSTPLADAIAEALGEPRPA
jgi:hypothetical protein